MSIASTKVFKLTTGEDVVGKVVFDNEITVTIENPARFVIAREGVGMMPFFPFSSSKQHTFKHAHIICSGDVEEEVYSAWSAQFGTGIVLGSGEDMQAIAKTLKLNPKK